MRETVPPLAGCVVCLWVLWTAALRADPVPVRVPEVASRASLVLRTLEGRTLASGEQSETVSDGTVTSRVTFRFADTSLHDETTVFSQRGVLRLMSYHLIQSGPSFRWALDITIDARTGRVVVRHKDRDGEEEVEDRRIDLPPDVANGMMVPVLKNLEPSALPARASFVGAAPEPRLVALGITRGAPGGQGAPGADRGAVHYVVKAEIGGLPGLVAPLIGKQPPDTHVWIFQDPKPSFARSEGPLFYGGPVWRIEIAP
jgi:hypothetical protein